jgi:3-phenylpropionate/cinnamic acid dioxygenase small subunit
MAGQTRKQLSRSRAEKDGVLSMTDIRMNWKLVMQRAKSGETVFVSKRGKVMASFQPPLVEDDLAMKDR